MAHFIDLTEQRFDRLLVIERHPQPIRSGECVRWVCQCDCGNTVTVRSANLRQGVTRSCGCLHRDTSRVVAARLTWTNTTHGLTNTLEYIAWQNLKTRCLRPNHPSYKNYGGRGITVCDRWRESFEAFYEDMGSKPEPKSSYSIDRIDNDGNYSCGKCSQCIENGWPMNCRWATRKEQVANRRCSKKAA